MKVKFGAYIAIGVGVLVAIGIFSFSGMQTTIDQNIVFHVTLADPRNYVNGVYTETFEIKKGVYRYGFVPNGDSPQNLTISLKGESVNIEENFILNGIPHETEISLYYTWEYSGDDQILIPEDQIVEITINPNGNLLGPVTVDIL